MKRKLITLLAAAALCTSGTYAYDLKGLVKGAAQTLGNTDANDALGAIGSLLGQSNVEVKDLAGSWTYAKPAVSFQSDNLLKQAGGLVAAQAVENKILPYYKQFGVDKMTMTVDKDGQFVINVRNIPAKGVIEKDSDGNFSFNFQALGTYKIGKIKAYVVKSGSNIDITFDVTKAMEIATKLLSSTGNSNLSALSSLLGGYDGLCVGVELAKTNASE